MLNLTLVEQTSSAEVSWLIRGWVNQNRNSMTDLSRPLNERSALQISFRSGDLLTPACHSTYFLRSDRSGNHRHLSLRLFPNGFSTLI